MFYQVWEKNSEAVIARLQEHSLAPQRLASVDWRLQINMCVLRAQRALVLYLPSDPRTLPAPPRLPIRAQDDATKLKGTSALFQFNLATHDATVRRRRPCPSAFRPPRTPFLTPNPLMGAVAGRKRRRRGAGPGRV